METLIKTHAMVTFIAETGTNTDFIYEIAGETEKAIKVNQMYNNGKMYFYTFLPKSQILETKIISEETDDKMALAKIVIKNWLFDKTFFSSKRGRRAVCA